MGAAVKGCFVQISQMPGVIIKTREKEKEVSEGSRERVCDQDDC